MRGYRHVIMFIRYENGMYVIDTELDMLCEMKRRYKELYHFNPVLNNMTQNNKKENYWRTWGEHGDCPCCFAWNQGNRGTVPVFARN